MLAIRLQRTGRKGHAQYRMIVQEARLSPTSGRVVALLGNYDPHTKAFNVEKSKAEFYLKNGAQPSGRVSRLLKEKGIKLPDWVQFADDRKRAIRNPEKLRRNQPKEEVPAEAPAADVSANEEVAAE